MAAQACPSCGAPQVGGARSCPACGNSYSQEYVGIAETIPQIPGQNPPRPAADTMPCPMCSEPIPRTSTRCKWCGENVGAAKPTGMGAQNYQPAPPPPPAYNQPPLPPGVARPDPTPALIVSLIALIGGWLCGILFILGPVGWIMANSYIAKCRAIGMEPDGSGTAAKVCSIIATVIMGLALMLIVLWVVLVVVVGVASR